MKKVKIVKESGVNVDESTWLTLYESTDELEQFNINEVEGYYNLDDFWKIMVLDALVRPVGVVVDNDGYVVPVFEGECLKIEKYGTQGKNRR